MSFLALEPLIVAQLETALPDVRVLNGEDLNGVQESAQPTPAVHVIYDGFRVTDSNTHGRQAMTEQRWLVVIVVKHEGSAPKSAAEAKQRAAPLVDAVLDALMGWRPNARPGTPGLTLATPPKPVHRPPFYYFPLSFTANVPVTGANQ